MLSGEKITGDAAADYSIMKKMPDSLSRDNAVTIRFAPLAAGLRTARYEAVTDDGKRVSVDLLGNGRPSVPLEFAAIKELSTDTVGGDASIPIRINGLDKAETVELSVSFDRNLEYRGTTSLSGVRLDVAGTTTKNYSRIRIPAAEIRLNDISAYSNFSVFADTEMVSRVSLDSLVVLSAQAACQYITDTRTQALVTGPSGCSIPTLSGFLRYGKMPKLEIYPNPTTGIFTIRADEPLGVVSIEISDKLGVIRGTWGLSLEHGGAKIEASQLASGTYFVRVIAGGFTSVLPLVIEK
jgi:hypothetical protein